MRFFTRWLLSRSAAAEPSRRRPAFRRPRLEALEDRVAPAHLGFTYPPGAVIVDAWASVQGDTKSQSDDANLGGLNLSASGPNGSATADFSANLSANGSFNISITTSGSFSTAYVVTSGGETIPLNITITPDAGSNEKDGDPVTRPRRPPRIREPVGHLDLRPLGSYHGYCRGREIPGPSTGNEVIAPGRQGIRAKRDTNPARRSANLLWDHAPRHLHSARLCPRSLALSRGGQQCVNPARQSRQRGNILAVASGPDEGYPKLVGVLGPIGFLGLIVLIVLPGRSRGRSSKRPR
jgi:hypothetical protein